MLDINVKATSNSVEITGESQGHMYCTCYGGGIN